MSDKEYTPQTLSDIQNLYNACHDYPLDNYEFFPTFEQVKDAWKDGRVDAKDCYDSGYITITGDNACTICFDCN